MNPQDAASILPRKMEGDVTSVDASGSFTMYALVFGNVDRQGDLIEPNAVTNVDELTKDGWIALNHDQTAMPIAMIDSAEQDGRGLKLSGRFHSHLKAQEVRSYVKERLDAGKAVKTSIGYLVPVDGERYERVEGRTVRHISKMSVYEASFVNLPANPAAEVVSAKSLDGINAVESEEEMSAAAMLRDVKRALGLQSKGSYKVDGEEMEKAKGLVEKCSTLRKSISAHHKAMKDAIDDHDKASDELTKCFKNFSGGQQQPEDPNNEGDVADKEEDESQQEDDAEVEEEKPEPRGKARKAPSTKDDEEDADTKAWRASLQRELAIESLSEDVF